MAGSQAGQISAASAAVSLKNEADAGRALSRRLAAASIVGAGAALLGIAVAAATFVWRPAPVYYSVTPDLRVIKMTPLQEPYISDQGLLDWTSAVVCQTLRLDFLRFREELTSVEGDYTPAAFRQVVGMLQSSGQLDMIRHQRLLMSAIPEAPPVIESEGELAGRYAWKISFPILVSYEGSGTASSKVKMVATALVVRVPTTFNPRGVAIQQVNVVAQGGAQ